MKNETKKDIDIMIGFVVLILGFSLSGKLQDQTAKIFMIFVWLAGLYFIISGFLELAQENISPFLTRQRLIIEAVTDHCVLPEEFKDYLVKLSGVVGMKVLSEPFAYPADDMGYGGWIHWVTSGTHIYSYPKSVTRGYGHLLTVDTYTCKAFDIKKAIDFTKEYFSPEIITWREV